jgi:hypothetical protein
VVSVRAVLFVTVAALAPVAHPSEAAPVPACVNQVAGVNDRCETWSRVVNDRTSEGAAVADTARGIAVNKSGDRLYVLTTSNVGSAPAHITVTALKPASRGATLWTAHAPTPLTTRAKALALSPDGRTVVVTGQADYLPNLNARLQTYWFTAAFDAATGRALWSALFRASGADAPVAIAVSPRGDAAYVTGTSTYMQFTEWNTVAYGTRTGKRLWGQRYGGQAGGNNVPAALATSPNGDRVFVTGTSEHPQHTGQHVWDVAVAAYDARTGRVLWLRLARVGASQYPTAMAVSPKGDAVYVAGHATTGTVTTPVAETLRLAYATNGRPLWQSHLALATAVDAVGIVVSPKGDRVYVTGARSAAVAPAAGVPAQQATIGVQAVDARTGRATWTASYAPPAGASAVPRRLVLDRTGTHLYVAADLVPAPTLGYPLVVSFTSAGKVAWTARYDVRDPAGGGTGLAGGVSAVDAVVDAGGRLYVAVDDAPAAPPVDTQVCAVESAAGVAGCATAASHAALVLAYAG